MPNENAMNRDMSFGFGQGPGGSDSNPVNPSERGDIDMPILSRNHSLFGYLDLPSLSRNTSLSRGYDDPFGPSPRPGGMGGSLGPVARVNSWDAPRAGAGIAGQNLTSVGSNPAYPSLFTGAGATDLYHYSGANGKSGGIKNGEHLVHYILAKPLHTDVGAMGIPCFDQSKSLIGKHDVFSTSHVLTCCLIFFYTYPVLAGPHRAEIYFTFFVCNFIRKYQHHHDVFILYLCLVIMPQLSIHFVSFMHGFYLLIYNPNLIYVNIIIIGFYREGQGHDKTTTILDYIPISSLISVLKDADILKAKNNLESNILSRNPSVHTLDNEKNNLDMMKEDAMIYSLKIESEEEENSHNNDKKENILMDTKEGNSDE